MPHSIDEDMLGYRGLIGLAARCRFFTGMEELIGNGTGFRRILGLLNMEAGTDQGGT